MRRSQAAPRPAARAPAARPAARAPQGAKREVAKIPLDVVNEQVIIAAAIFDPEARARLMTLTPDGFYGKGHPEIWAAMRELVRRGLDYDPATLQQLGGGKLDLEYLDELVRVRSEAPANLGYHIDNFHWDRTRVEGSRGPLAALIEGLQDVMAERGKIVALAQQVGRAFSSGGGQLRYLRDPQQLIREQGAIIRARREGIACYPYGIEGFDRYPDDDLATDLKGRPLAGRARLIPGASPTTTTVVTGTPGSGKTTLIAWLAVAFANMQRRVLVGAWEQGSAATLELCAAISLAMSRSDLSEGLVDDDEEARLLQEMERLSEYLKFFELPTPAEKLGKNFNDRVLDTIHETIVASAAEVFIADLWRRAVREFDPEEEELALYRQQGIAQETKCHNILVHQQKLKDVEARKDKRPTRESIKGSAAWVEVADTIIGTHRQALWKDVEDVVIELDILKQRKAKWPQAVECDFDPDAGQITNGRSVAYMRSDEIAVDEFLDTPAAKAPGTRRRGPGATRA